MKKITLFSISVIMTIFLVNSSPDIFADSTPTLPTGDFTITGAGATFPFPLIDLWRVEYNKEFSNINLNYQSIGSGGGIKQHIEKTVNFAASDAPMRESEKKLAEGTLHIPESIGGVVIAYNIPEVPEKGLKLTGEIISDIYLGKIIKWNDPKIIEHNSDFNLPDEEIIPARRSDGSGTTFVFTDYLATISPEFDEIIGKGKSVPWPTGVGAAGNEGVAGIIRSTPYSIGYVELAYAFQTGMSYAFIQNGDGTSFIEPTLDSISAASAGVADNLPSPESDWSSVSLVNAPGADSYPIASFTYLLVYDELSKATTSKEQAQTVIHMIHWMITDGQNFSPTLLYVPLSDKVVELGKNALSQVKYEGETLWEYSGVIETESEIEIPSWVKQNAGWWADGAIADSDFVSGIQFLISNGIMNIPETESGESSGESIPDWVKQNAGWWADGAIADSDFISGIQYLITKGIMQI